MTSTPLPALPLSGIVLGAALFCTSGYIWLGPPTATPIDMTAVSLVEPAPDDVTVTPLIFHTEALTTKAIADTISRSPFAQDRSAYSRTRTAEKAPTLVYDPQFIGTTGNGTSIKALVRWQPGRDPQSIALGDETPWGHLKSASASQLTFEAESGETKILSMF